MKKLVTVLLIFCFAIPVFTQSFNKQLNNELELIAKEGSIKGFGVAIFSKDTLFYNKGFGLASNKGDKKYTTRTRQKIASISKLLLGVSMVKAQELGLLEMDDSVNDYLPFSLVNPHFPDEIITIRHLASHTSGLAKIPKYDLKGLYAPTKIPKIKKEMPFGIRKWFFNKTIKSINSNEEHLLEDFVSNIYSTDGKWYSKKHFRKVQPGVQTEYSNSGASLLALIIESASGVPYQDFVKLHITNPLQLKNSKFDFEESSTMNEPSDYYHADITIPSDYRLLLYPAGGYESTIEDFSIFIQTIAANLHGGNNFLSKESIDEMLTPQFNTEHGILWEVYDDGNIGHRGDILGATSFAYYDTKKDLGYILFCNTAGTKSLDNETYEIRNLLKNYLDTSPSHE